MSSFLKHILTQLCGQGVLNSEFSICLGFLPSCSQGQERMVLGENSPHPCSGMPSLAMGWTLPSAHPTPP